jgi:hypothetical protein
MNTNLKESIVNAKVHFKEAMEKRDRRVETNTAIEKRNAELAIKPGPLINRRPLR